MRVHYDSRTETVELIDEAPPVEPPIDPPPVEPPAAALPIVSSMVPRPQAVIMGAMLPDLAKHWIFVGFSNRDRYIREQRPAEVAGQTLENPQGVSPLASIRADLMDTVPQLTFGADWTATVTLSPFDPEAPELLGTPQAVASVAVLAAARTFSASFDKSSIAEGWYMLAVDGAPAGFGVLPFPVYVRHGGNAKAQTHTPVIVGSYKHSKTHRLSYSLVPAKFEPITVPLPHREYPPIAPFPLAKKPVAANPSAPTPEEKAAIAAWNAHPKMQNAAYTMLVPFKRDDVYRPSVLPSGVVTTACIQNYHVSSYEADKPRWQILEGERGRGNLTCAMALRLTHRPGGGKIVFAQAWNVGTMGDNGKIGILAGYVHDQTPPAPLYPYRNATNPQRAPTPLRMVGDWSALPAGRNVPRQIWDVAVDYRTTVVDESAPAIGDPPEHPHPGDVVYYVANSQIHNVLKVTMSGQDRAAPAVVTEFVYKQGGFPWNCETVGNLLIVTWRDANVVEAYDMDANGAVVWTRVFTQPTGLRELNGVLYIGSAHTWTVTTMPVDVDTRAKFCDVPHDGNSSYVNLAVAMDTFAPGVNCATVTWSGFNSGGWPIVYGPDGKRLAVGDREQMWGEPRGTYLPDGLSYPTSVAMDSTRMVWATVQDGLHQVSGALPTDAVVPPECARGAKKMYDLDLELAYSDYFFGHYGLPMPWGKYGADVDALMDNMRHAR